MFVSNQVSFFIGRWIALLTMAAIAFLLYAPPRVSIFYSKEGAKDISYILNIQDRIVKGGLTRGQSIGDVGHIFPNNEFFMEFYWWRDNERRHCVSIMPKRPQTSIYLNADGNIDKSKGSGTDVALIKNCEWDTAEP
ncbi:MAG: hypothetical protein ACOH2R_20170 [Pseudomonas sp.]